MMGWPFWTGQHWVELIEAPPVEPVLCPPEEGIKARCECGYTMWIDLETYAIGRPVACPYCYSAFKTLIREMFNDG